MVGSYVFCIDDYSKKCRKRIKCSKGKVFSLLENDSTTFREIKLNYKMRKIERIALNQNCNKTI